MIRRSCRRPLRHSLAALLCAGLLLPMAARAAGPGQALVIGAASYTGFPPLHACALSAHSVTAALRRLGFTVDEQEDASSGALFAGIAALTRKLKANPAAPAFVYVCTYASAFDGRPFLLPVSAQIARPADLLTQGVLAKSLVDAVTRNTSAPAVIALDAIPVPNAPDSLALDQLAEGLPVSVGLLGVRDTGQGERPTPLAALLAPALKGPDLHAAALLAGLKPRLDGEPSVRIGALHLPSGQLYLAGGPASAAPAAAPAKSAAAPGGSASVPGGSATAPVESAAAPAGSAPRAAPAAASSASPPAAPAAPAAQAVPAAQGAPMAAPAGSLRAASLPAASRPAASLPDENQMTGAQRRQVQQALAGLGYYDGRIDGIFGPETHAAIRRWQHELHAPMTGHLTGPEATRLTSG